MQHKLPDVRGIYKFNVPLSSMSFFKVGGICDIVYYPEDVEDLETFLKEKPKELKIAVLGNLSNILASDQGFRGCLIKLDNLKKLEFHQDYLFVESGKTLPSLINECAKQGVSCCEDLFCIPGSIGGAVSMNAGIPGFEIKDVLISIDLLDFTGKKLRLRREDLNMSYRNGNIPRNTIITSALFKTSQSDSSELSKKLQEIRKKRLSSQPISQATCGSTFKNPQGLKAWQLIKESGCDRLKVGGAEVSGIHSNFLINTGKAKASDFKELINLIKEKVLEKTGVLLEEEIIRFGEDS